MDVNWDKWVFFPCEYVLKLIFCEAIPMCIRPVRHALIENKY